MQIVSIDPGMRTGFVNARIDSGNQPLKIISVMQYDGGLDGFIDRTTSVPFADVVIFEKFRVGPRVYTAEELEALAIWGWVYTLRRDVVVQYNDAMLIGGVHGSPSLNKRAADQVLKDLGLWHVGSDLEMSDANDVNSAMKHLVHYALAIGHKDTVDRVMEIRDGMR